MKFLDTFKRILWAFLPMIMFISGAILINAVGYMVDLKLGIGITGAILIIFALVLNSEERG